MKIVHHSDVYSASVLWEVFEARQQEKDSPMRIKDHVFLVTGGASGPGGAVAEFLARERRSRWNLATQS